MLQLEALGVRRFLRRPSLILTACFACAGSCGQGEIPTFTVPVVGTLPVPLQMHGSAVVGERLYCFGGEDTAGWTDACQSGAIGSDGRIQKWRAELSLPLKLHYLANCVATVADRIYIVGGSVAPGDGAASTATSRNMDVLWTSVNRDGSLQPWKQSPFTPNPGLSFMAACSSQGKLYAVGGNVKNEVSREIYVCDVAGDGEPRNWRSAGRMPEPRWFHGAAIVDGRLFVWGGLQTAATKGAGSLIEAVWSGPLSSSGEIGEWRAERPMQSPVYASAFVADDSFLVSVGGRYQDRSPTNALWYARLENGRPGEWQMVNTNLEGRVYTSIAASGLNRQIFVSGGQTKTTSLPGNPQLTDAVYGFRLSEPK